MLQLYQSILLFFIILCSVVTCSAFIGLTSIKLQQLLFNLRLTKHKETVYQYGSVTPSLHFQEQQFLQPLDHFDTLVKRVFPQRYWVNKSYWSPGNGPVFLFIGGEEALNQYSVLSGEHVELAAKYKALIFAVEHRFYGESLNKEDGLTLKSLQYLSSQQALADLAAFHGYAVRLFNLTDQNPWISFGGSYAGALAIWFRTKYPHLVQAAVASSPPVSAQLDFTGYNDVVAKSLNNVVVGGSDQCVQNIRSAFQYVDVLLQQKNWTRLATDFQTCDPFTSTEDVFEFTSNLANPFMQAVQYNGELPVSIVQVCDRMTHPNSTAYQNLLRTNQFFLVRLGANCTSNSWRAFLAELSDSSSQQWQFSVGYRQWLYQSCTQFGFFQTCESTTSCPFSHFMTLNSSLEVCRDLFKLDPVQVSAAVTFTNDYYGGLRLQGSKILIVNGLIDPWHAVSLVRNVSGVEEAVIIPDGAHCEDMTRSQRISVEVARQKISNQISLWLKT